MIFMKKKYGLFSHCIGILKEALQNVKVLTFGRYFLAYVAYGSHRYDNLSHLLLP